MNIVSLGAGVQSTTLLLMAGHGELGKKPDCAIFADTGWEPQAVYDHFEWLKAESKRLGIPVYETTKGNIRADLVEASKNHSRSAAMPFYVWRNGKQGIIPRQCTAEYKIEAVNAKVRELLGYTKRQRIPKGSVTKWMGISTDEIHRAKTKSSLAWEKLRYPLIELGMNRLDCMNWLARKGYKVPQKSSCIGCPYHSDYTWLAMKRNDPSAFAEAVEFEQVINANGLRGLNGKIYLHRSCRPLDQVDFGENQIEFEFEGFGNECEGMCGV
ncbi:hypothetical protein M5X00_29860 [Paenibacillus alvei]|uniref:hypothetical protein n=1 Tax=Paenibacillus alvei TaxID=44250 RepID=UPI000287F95F|nr:hypothetical protein [Paenibacillus alvei]EJW14540.1 hypothetical protein PAV_13c01590 [Paenibacillus alvei DSM 29]MCY9540003.1 hypothetical protein [Paenibacillus alvei]MCY9708349.1 hypothetical protein [Paenibacillus alvei]MCY9738080.1 hypothetical protein [Paenibacillus alvei]MCY9758428.1 hypothetical protein [Paenibacillus alvei]